jgi:hypothetical protein
MTTTIEPTSTDPATAEPTSTDPPAVALTRTCQDQPTTDTTDTTDTETAPPFTTAELITALEHAWSAIRSHHPDVPAVVLIVSSGSPSKTNQALTYGHFANLRWQHGDQQLPEVMVSGEGLTRTPAEVFTTLLHEATHALAAIRGIKDTSRQGRWHNKQFAALAAELGMTTVKDRRIGFSPCTLTDDATTRYREPIGRITAAVRAYRHTDALETAGRTNSNNGLSCECLCPRKLRVAASVLDEGPILCAVCVAWFLPEDADRDAYTDEFPVPTRQPDPGDHQADAGDGDAGDDRDDWDDN